MGGLVPSEACPRRGGGHCVFTCCSPASTSVSTLALWRSMPLDQSSPWSLIFTALSLSKLCLQTRSHSEVLGIRTSTYGFQGGTVQPKSFSLPVPVTHRLSSANCPSHSHSPPSHDDDSCFCVSDAWVFTLSLTLPATFRCEANCLLGTST